MFNAGAPVYEEDVLALLERTSSRSPPHPQSRSAQRYPPGTGLSPEPTMLAWVRCHRDRRRTELCGEGALVGLEPVTPSLAPGSGRRIRSENE